jgi:hypothetical protein
MNSTDALHTMAGHWVGTKTVVLPNEPDRTSPAEATVTVARGGRSAAIAYRWAFEDAPQDGLMAAVLGHDETHVALAFIDSWHMAGDIMLCRGTVNAAGTIDVRGAYAVPDSPDWGWRIVLEMQQGQLRVTMYNVAPSGEEFTGVVAQFTRPS